MNRAFDLIDEKKRVGHLCDVTIVNMFLYKKRELQQMINRTWMPNRPLGWLLSVKRVQDWYHHHRCLLNAMNGCVPIGCVSLSVPNTVNDPSRIYYPNHRQYWCHHRSTMDAVAMQPPPNFCSYSKNDFGSCVWNVVVVVLVVGSIRFSYVFEWVCVCVFVFVVCFNG